MTKKYTCFYYCCKNQDDDVKVIWICVGNFADDPDPPFESICKKLTVIEVDNPHDCKNYAGMISLNDNQERKQTEQPRTWASHSATELSIALISNAESALQRIRTSTSE